MLRCEEWSSLDGRIIKVIHFLVFFYIYHKKENIKI